MPSRFVVACNAAETVGSPCCEHIDEGNNFMYSQLRRSRQAIAALLATAGLLVSVLALGLVPAAAAVTEPGFDVDLSVSQAGGVYGPGDTIVYELSTTNVGSTFAKQVFFNVYVPTHTVANLAESTHGFDCSPVPATAGANCTIDIGNIQPGETVNVVFAVDVVASLPPEATETTFWPGCDPTPNAPGPDYDCNADGVFVGGSPFPEVSYDNNRAEPIVTQLAVPVPCQPGTFSATGSAPCEPTPPGTFVAIAGATAATQCQVGTYQPLAGQAECLRAPVGSYVDVTGAIATTPCPDGTSTIGIGSANAADCLADFDGDGIPDVVDPDDDNDGVDDAADRCAETDLAGDTAPDRLKKNRFWSDASGAFVGSGLTVADTGGCSASQIIDAAGLGNGHQSFGISRSALNDWIASA